MTALAVLGALPRNAAAEPAAAGDRDPREAEARKACLLGEYQRGVALLVDLFEETRDPNYIFNQGRCYEQSGRAEEAINRFREYLRKAKDLSAEEIAEAKQHIHEMEEIRDRRQAAATPAAAPPEPTPGRKLRLAGMIVAGVGVAAVATGAIFGLQVQSQEKKVMNANSYDPDEFAKGERAATRQWIGYGVGAAAIGTGAVLYLLGRSADARVEEVRPSVSFLPMLMPGRSGAGGALRLGF